MNVKNSHIIPVVTTANFHSERDNLDAVSSYRKHRVSPQRNGGSRLRLRHIYKTVIVALCLGAILCGQALAKTQIVQFASVNHGDAHREFLEASRIIYEAQNPDVQIEIITGDQNKAMTMIVAGAQLDVIDMSTNEAPQFFASGLLKNLAPYIAKDKSFDIRAFVPVSTLGYQARGEVFGLPTSTFQILCWYNKDLFQQAGVLDPNELGSNWNWESVISAGKKLTRDTTGDGVPDQWGVQADNSFYRWPIFVHQAGGLLFDRVEEPTKPTFGSPAAQKGVEFFASLYKEHNITVGVSKMWEAYKFFTAGQIGFTLSDGPSMFNYLARNALGKFEWDLAQLPKGPDNNGTLVIMNGFQMTVNAKNPEATWHWLKFLVSQERSMDFMLRTGRTPARIALLREFPRTLEIRPQHTDAAGDAVLNPASKHNYISPILPSLHKITSSVLNPVLQGSKSVEQALHEFDIQAAGFLADLGKK